MKNLNEQLERIGKTYELSNAELKSILKSSTGGLAQAYCMTAVNGLQVRTFCDSNYGLVLTTADFWQTAGWGVSIEPVSGEA